MIGELVRVEVGRWGNNCIYSLVVCFSWRGAGIFLCLQNFLLRRALLISL